MNLEQLGKIPFPQDLTFHSMRYDDPYFSVVHLIEGLSNKSAIKNVVRITDAHFVTDNWDHAFTWHGQYIGGPNDGEVVSRMYVIKTDAEFRNWLFRMALLQMPRMNTWGPGGYSYLDAWHDFRVIFMGQNVAMLTAPKDEYLFPIHVASNQCKCSQCGKTSPIFWTRSEINEWIVNHKWCWIDRDKDSLLMVCKQCGEKLIS